MVNRPKSIEWAGNTDQVTATEFIYNMASRLGIDVMPNIANYRSNEGLWGKNSSRRQMSHKIATRILTAPCTSAAVERSFSLHGNIHNRKRNGLTSERAAKIAYIAYNWNLTQRQEPNNDSDYRRLYNNTAQVDF
ncbi:hypothetical protein NE865_06358 [Phthorimaea operculella]|nr:hypothetical protein NE865_06358 [Phthorimaea operculella]